MTLQYALTEEDYLQHQLFVASQTPRIKKQRTQSWVILSGSFLLLGGLFYESDNNVLTWYFLIFGVFTFCFYPMYQKRYYRRYYQKHIADTYKNKFDQTANIVFETDYMLTSDVTGELKMNITEVERMEETGNYIYLKVKSGGHLVIPKSQLPDVTAVRQHLKAISEKLGVTYSENLQWKWK